MTMHPEQLTIPTDLVQRLVEDHFPQYRALPISALDAGGTTNAIFRIGASMTARFPLRKADPFAALNSLRAEQDAMREFGAHAKVAAPLPLGTGRPGQGYPMPWSLQSWLDGDVATPETHAATVSLAEDIAALIAGLRGAELRGRSFSGTGRGGNLPDHDRWMAECLKNSVGLLDVERLRSLWARLRLLPEAGPLRMSHKDLIPANLLVRGGRLSGVLDTGGFAPADPALDLVAAWHLFDGACRDVVRTRLRCSEIEWLRGAAWAYQQAMGLVWYYHETNPGMAALGRTTLTRLLGDAEITAGI